MAINKQKRYNLMIVGQEAIGKLDSLPERGKGGYVSEAIKEKIEREQNGDKVIIAPIIESTLRKIVREEIEKYIEK